MSTLHRTRAPLLSIGPCLTAVLVTALYAWRPSAILWAQSDLDALMRQALAHREENWKKLQQYVLEEREEVELRAPGQATAWGERRDYAWFIKDGLFIRSPLAVNGAGVGESDRRKYEAAFLERERAREARALRRQADVGPGVDPPAPAAPARMTSELDNVIRQTREPQFISSAYFLRFRFDEGRYGLVGRERLDNREVLRIEYYPSNLFAERRRTRDSSSDPRYADEIRRLVNKSSLVTLWVDPSNQQILRYTFDNLGLDFFPGQWLVRVADMTATMNVIEAFPSVWLPDRLDVRLDLMMALGRFELRYGLTYHDYRRADVSSVIRVPDGR